MNPLPPNTDELVSAYLDGEAAPDEVVMVESSPELMARVEALRAVSAQLGSASPPPAAQKEAHLAAALGLFDELFESADTTQQPTTGVPALHAVPAAATAPAVPPAEVRASPPVTSLDAARERRKPRRFNMGVIAAALAALLLIVGLAVVGGGRGGDDVASTAAEGASADSADFAADEADGDASDDFAEDEAMEESADTASAAEAPGGLSSADQDRAQPLPTPDPPAAAAAPQDEDDAMEMEAAAEDSEVAEAMDDDESEEASAGDGAGDGDGTLRFFFGEFDEIEQLETELNEVSLDAGLFDQELLEQNERFSCRLEVAELQAGAVVNLLGEALIGADGRTPNEVEVYSVANDETSATIYIVDSSECSILSATIVGG